MPITRLFAVLTLALLLILACSLPTRLPVAPTPPGVSRAATPRPSAPCSEQLPLKFAASRTNIAVGETVTLMWNVGNATSVTLRGGDLAEQPVPFEGRQDVRPTTTTVYTLHVESGLGPCDAQVTIVVTGQATAGPGVVTPRATLPSATSVPTQTRPPAPTVPPTAPAQVACQDEACMTDGMQLSYLIVTRPLFIPALTPFINWKTTQGYRVGLVTADWLAQRFAGRHLAERLKTGLHTLRRQTGLHYVLLVGDTEVPLDDFTPASVSRSYNLQAPWNIPTGFYTRADSPREDAFLSDAYFVEDRDWDPQNTGRNPMPQQQTGVGGEGSFEATLFLGRWPVRRPEEIAPIVAKTRAVAPAQKIFFTSDVTLSRGTPYPDASCLSEPLPSASNPRAACYSDAMGTARLRLFENNAPWLQTESLFVDLNDPAQVDQLFRRLSAADGVTVGLYHGAYNCWVSGRLCPLVQTTDNTIRTFDNFRFTHNFPLLIADGCYIAAFYAGANDTVFESFLKVSSGPAVIAQAPNNLMFLHALREGRPVGEAFWRSGACYFIWGNPIHLLGDPSLPALRGPR